MPVRTRSFLPLLALPLLAIGCKHDAEPVKIPGWIETQSSGVAFSLPQDMKVSDLSSGDLSEIQKGANNQYAKQPELKKVVDKLASSGAMKMVARLPGSPNSFNLVVQPVDKAQTLVTLVEPNRVQMKAVAIPGTLTVEMHQFPVGQAAYFQFDLTSGGATHTQTTYILLHDSKEFVFTFSSSVSDKKIWGSIAESAMKSVHFLD